MGAHKQFPSYETVTVFWFLVISVVFVVANFLVLVVFVVYVCFGFFCCFVVCLWQCYFILVAQAAKMMTRGKENKKQTT